MSIFHKLKDMGQAMGAKVKETFGDPTEGIALPDENGEPSPTGPPLLDAAAARSILGVAPHATLDQVREAAHVRARALYPLAHRDGITSEAARTLERDLDALELLEEILLPLASASTPAAMGPPVATEPRRKRATPRQR